jgi:rhamnulokinase
MAAVAAVDFGATSVRVARVVLGEGPPQVQVVHRYPHAAVRHPGGHLHWDWSRLVAEAKRGIAAAAEIGPLASIGVDTWAVDYGLLDRHGRLLATPFAYRDHRTDGYRALVDRIGEERLYSIAGLQLLPFNTIFQLAAEDPDRLKRARSIVMLPELVVFELTGALTGERTSAGSTGLLDVHRGTWSAELCDAVDLRSAMLPEIRAAGECVGAYEGIPVHLVGGHDTASAVAAGAVTGEAFVSSGTWLLVGVERDEPDTSEAARSANFTNEAGVAGGIRFLRNVTGFWFLEECRRVWGNPPVERLVQEAMQVSTPMTLVDPMDQRFLAPADMPVELAAAVGLSPHAPRGVLARVALESMAAGVATVVNRLGAVTGVRVFGGGANVSAWLSMVAERTGLPVSAGPIEAAAVGNAMIQGVALGIYDDVTAARTALRADVNEGRS